MQSLAIKMKLHWPLNLDTFPIVRRHDKAAFGTYRTKDMVLAYYNALAAGDTEVDVCSLGHQIGSACLAAMAAVMTCPPTLDHELRCKCDLQRAVLPRPPAQSSRGVNSYKVLVVLKRRDISDCLWLEDQTD